ncbi:SDR family NAD(P)-dependent oxidoreductase [Streptomyces sp. N2-109]|uniref:SDR family NAD(P)-dependent oxidoreductase n=1 Tax=Streptomyces gossypii TaxID=2883101 RepID=A0ABT2JPR1_9ACTN|nr:SDR family NAD(P)-dependent oxidoreductase [Streptomyces gossypii]MCT2589269.1 SDR family NAD(P)-dependent oxidoreductase [Streptomyces gossypii]
MDLELTGKTAVVTGASRGIGLATVTTLLSEGMRVAAAARTITPELARTGALAVPVDLSTADGPAHFVERATAELGEIDLLVNNVGGGDVADLTDNGQLKGFLGLADEQWQKSFELNLFAAVRTTRAALPSLLRQRGGIVNISSNGARAPQTGPVVYTTAKAALTALGKALAEEFGPSGVRVNTVSPGPVRTALFEDPDGYGAQLAASMGIGLEQLLKSLPASMGMITDRLLQPSEVAAQVAFLASPHCASVMGSDVLVDGGAVKTV